MSQSSGHTQIIRVGIHSVPEDQHGWRGLELPGNRKRKWYTLLENEQCLVTALLIPPGEIGVRHSHETGELNIHFSNGLPLVRWNAPGELHGGYSPQAPIDDPEQAQRLNDAEQRHPRGRARRRRQRLPRPRLRRGRVQEDGRGAGKARAIPERRH